MTSRLLELGPDDDLFPGWCAVWAAAQRIGLYRRISTSLSARYPRCRATILDFTGARGSHSLQGAADPGQWFDDYHFSPAVGAEILDAAMRTPPTPR